MPMIPHQGDETMASLDDDALVRLGRIRNRRYTRSLQQQQHQPVQNPWDPTLTHSLQIRRRMGLAGRLAGCSTMDDADSSRARALLLLLLPMAMAITPGLQRAANICGSASYSQLMNGMEWSGMNELTLHLRFFATHLHNPPHLPTTSF